MVATLLFVACDDDGASAKKSDDGEEVAHVVDTLYVFSKDTVYSVARDTVYSVARDTVYFVDRDTVYSEKTVHSVDTFVVQVKDSVFFKETIVNVDTIYSKDTIYSRDTLVVRDSIVIKDTIYARGLDGQDGTSCSVKSLSTGAEITCGRNKVTIDNGSLYLKDTACVYSGGNDYYIYMKCGSKEFRLRTNGSNFWTCTASDYEITCSDNYGSFRMCKEYCGSQCFYPDYYYCVNKKTYSKAEYYKVPWRGSTSETLNVARYWPCGDYLYDLGEDLTAELYDKRLCVGGLTYVCENPLTLTNCEYYNMNSYIVK